MPKLVYGHPATTPWICQLLKMNIPENAVSIGIAKDDHLIGAALYHNYNLTFDGKPLFIEMSFGTVDKRWANKAIIAALLEYPFRQLKVKRIQSTVSKKNREVRLFLERLGFSLEGVGRLAWPHGGDAMMYSLLSREFFSSKWFISGQKFTSSSNSTRSSVYICGSDPEQRANCSL